MKYDFDSVVNRKNTNSLKWDLFDVEVPMWVADMDFKVAPEIQEALQLKINGPDLYTPSKTVIKDTPNTPSDNTKYARLTFAKSSNS